MGKQLESVLAIVLGLIAVYWFKRNNTFLLLALLIGSIGLLVPAAAGAIHWLWTKLSHSLGSVSGKIILTVVYLFVLIPLSILARLMGKVTLKRKPGGKSYFKEVNHTYSKEDIIHPW